MKHRLVFLFSYHQHWLQRVILLCSFCKVLRGYIALDCTLYLQKSETFTDGILPPSLPMSALGHFCTSIQLKKTCASELGVLIPSLMIYGAALNKMFNLTDKLGTAITSSKALGEEQRTQVQKDALQTAKGYRNII